MKFGDPAPKSATEKDPATPIDSAQKGVKQALPELEFREITKSEQPIDKIEGKKKKIEALCPWRNYTIVALEGSDKIIIFNEDAERVDDFNPPLSNKLATVNWGQAKKEGKISENIMYIRSPKGRTGSDTLLVSKLPSELVPFGVAAIGDSFTFEI